MEGVAEVLGLRDDEQVKTPAAAEVGYYNGYHGQGGQELSPGGLHHLCKHQKTEHRQLHPVLHTCVFYYTLSSGIISKKQLYCIANPIDISTKSLPLFSPAS